jgi:hypothetical protein
MKTSEPKIGQAFAEWMLAQNHHKDHAADTPFRFSAAMDCARHLGYTAAELPMTDPMDGASLAITAMGSLLHEDIQKAMHERWPDATFEGKGQIGDLISGHHDGIAAIDDPKEDELVELKTVGAYKWDLSIGLFRSPGRGKPAFIKPAGGSGPSKAHICQAGMNAVAHGRSKVRIVYLSREAVSVKKARQAGLGSIERFWAEWVFGREVWEPLVVAETERLAKIRGLVDGGMLPGRSDYDDNAGKWAEPDPETWWRCDGYCSQATRCAKDGPGRVPVGLSQPPKAS